MTDRQQPIDDSEIRPKNAYLSYAHIPELANEETPEKCSKFFIYLMNEAIKNNKITQRPMSIKGNPYLISIEPLPREQFNTIISPT